MATNLIIQTTDTSGKSLAKSISNVNPAATNQQISEFAKALNGLTTNSYVTVFKVAKEDVEAALKEEEAGSNG